MANDANILDSVPIQHQDVTFDDLVSRLDWICGVLKLSDDSSVPADVILKLIVSGIYSNSNVTHAEYLASLTRHIERVELEYRAN